MVYFYISRIFCSECRLWKIVHRIDSEVSIISKWFFSEMTNFPIWPIVRMIDFEATLCSNWPTFGVDSFRTDFFPKWLILEIAGSFNWPISEVIYFEETFFRGSRKASGSDPFSIYKLSLKIPKIVFFVILWFSVDIVDCQCLKKCWPRTYFSLNHMTLNSKS